MAISHDLIWLDIDGIPVDGTGDIVGLFRPSDEPANRTITTSVRSRSFLPPVFEDAHPDPWIQTFQIFRDPSVTALSTAAYRRLVHRVFALNGLERTLTFDFEGADYTLGVRIVSFAPQGHALWEGAFEILDSSLRAVAESGPETTSPIEILGNAIVRPEITITGGDALVRRHASIRDNTGEGIAGYLFSLVPPSVLTDDDYAVVVNGEIAAHKLSGGRIFFRADAKPGVPTFVELYTGSSIENPRAGKLDLAGMTLDANVASGVFTADPSQAYVNPLAPSLTWHLGPTVKHSRSREYEFGWVDDHIELVDRDATGERRTLQNDADSYMTTSPVPFSGTIQNLTFEVSAGYRIGRDEANVDDEEEPQFRVLRVRIRDIDGNPITEGPTWDPSRLVDTQTGGDPVWSGPLTYPNARNDYLYYGQFSWAGTTFPNTRTMKDDESDVDFTNNFGNAGKIRGTVWVEDYVPSEIKELVERFIGCEVETGEAGEWFLKLPAKDFAGRALPELGLDIQPKAGTWEDPDGQWTVTMPGDTSLEHILVMTQDEVDPVTHEPIEASTDPDGPSIQESLAGQTRVAIKVQYPDSEQWVTLWSQIVTGVYPDGTTETFSPNVDVSGAVSIAIGLEPVASDARHINWGSLRITSQPTVTVDATQRPSVNVSSDIQAQRIHGTLKNDTTGDYIRFDNVLCDAGGLVIDGELVGQHAIRSEPVDVWYGTVHPSGGTRLFDLLPGENEWTAIGELAGKTITFRWYEKLVV